MADHNKSKEELIIELEQLKQENLEIKLNINSFRKRIMNCEAIFESSPIAMFIIDETTNIVMVNLAAVKLCGGSEEEILQHRPGNALRCVHSVKDPRGCGYSTDCKMCDVRNAIEALIAKGGTVSGAELEFSLTIDGIPQKVWMNVGVEQIVKEGEKHWCIAMSDITKNKQIEELMRIREERFHGIFNNLQDAFFQADLSGNFTLASPSAQRMYGYDTLEEMIGMSASNLYANADVRIQIINELRSKGEITDYIGEAKRKDGSTFWVSMNIRFMYKDGQVSGTEGIVRDISDRKLAEGALKEKEEEYRSLVENLAVGIVVHDASSAIIMSNNTATQLLGLTDDQIKGKSAIDPNWGFLNEDLSVMPVDDYPANMVLASRKPLKNHVVGICRPNLGDVIWVICNGYPVFDKHGKIKNVVITFADITSRKNAEFEVISTKEKIEESEYRLKLATTAAGLGIWDWNLKENTMIWDARMFELYGTTPDTFPNNIDAWTNGLHPEDKQMALDECNAALNGEKEFNTSFRVLHPNGTVLYLKANGSVLRDENGKPIRMIGINRDITENRLAAIQLQVEKEKAEENKLRLQGIFDNMLDAFFQTDLQGKVTYANPAALFMYGYNSIDEILGISASTFYALNEEREKLIDELQKTGKKIDWNGQGLRKDGTTFWASMNASVICDINGKAIGTHSVVRDVTERKLAENKVAEQLDELQRWYNITSDREFRLLELKQEVNELLINEGKPPRYENV